MAKLAIIVIATLLVASCVESNKIHDLKQKLLHKYGGGRNFNSASASASAYGSGYGSSASAAASVRSGGSYGSNHAASSASVSGGYGSSAGGYGSSAAGYGGNHYSSQQQAASANAAVAGGYGMQQQAASANAAVAGGYGMQQQAASAGAAVAGGYGVQQQASSANAAVAGGYGVQQQASSANAAVAGGYGVQQQAASAGASVAGYAGGFGAGHDSSNLYSPAPAVRAPAPLAPVEPPKPSFDINRFKDQQGLSGGFKPYHGHGGVAASAAAATGANSATAAAQAGGYQTGGFVAPGTYAAASGTYANTNDNGIEHKHFSNEVENIENHEKGRADDNHYYNAQSYGKAADDHDHVNYNKNYENIMASPSVYHSVKSTESLLRDHNKSNRETGSAVLAKVHHSAGYEKHQKHFHQNANSGSVGSGRGAYAVENNSLNHSSNLDDELYFDSDGLNNANQNNQAAYGSYGAAGASSVLGAGFGGGAASSASVGGRYGGAAAAAAVN